MRWAYIQLHIAVLLAGFTAILGKLISLPETSLVWWRLLMAAAALLLLFALWRRSILLPARAIRQLLGVGALVGLHWLMFFGSVKYGNVSIALVCFSATGFFTALLEPLFMRSRWNWAELLLGLLCMGGIYIIFHFDVEHKVGIALGIGAAASGAIFAILNKKMVDAKLEGWHITLWEMIGALFTLSTLLPWFVLHKGQALLPVGFDWVWLMILALLCTVWAFYLQLQALKFISAVTLNITYNLEPVYGILLAFLLFGENKYLAGEFYVGLLLIALAVAIQMVRVKNGRA